MIKHIVMFSLKDPANAPKVTFLGDDGKTNLGMGCFDATWTLGRSVKP